MGWSDHMRAPCPVARSLALLGDRWTLLIVRDCLWGVQRFDDFVDRLGASRAIVRDRLRRLEADGLIRREAYSRTPPRHNYVLTDAGRALEPVLVTLAAWGARFAPVQAGAHLAPVEDAGLVPVHRDCGHALHPRMVCAACDGEVVPGAVRMARAA